MQIQRNVLLAPYTTFKIGGLAKYFTEVQSIDEIRNACDFVKREKIPFFVLGEGSNILISDSGFDGLVIKLKSQAEQKFQFWAGHDKTKTVSLWSGFSLASLVSEAVKNNLTGLEWAVGIPGTIGGAVAGNAGAFSLSISDVIKEVEIFDVNNLTIKQFNNSDCNFGYRSSLFKTKPDLIIAGANFILKKGESSDIKRKIKKYLVQRNKSILKTDFCAGSFFKNIEWKRPDIDKSKILKNFPELKKFSEMPKIPAGFLIDSLGLKGRKLGKAGVADWHANFILNNNGAKAQDILSLSGFVKDKVYSKYGLVLEEEVRLIGF